MTETIILWAIGGVALALVALACLVHTHLVRSHVQNSRRELGTPLTTADSSIEAPLARYQPMFRLLDGHDADYLERHRACPQAAARWQRAQRRVVRLYLRELAADFQQLHSRARVLVSLSPEPSQPLVWVLFQQQIAFWRALLWIEVRLSLSRGASRINPEALVAAFETVRQELSRASISPNQPA